MEFTEASRANVKNLLAKDIRGLKIAGREEPRRLPEVNSH